jgi:biotin carboxyl carrier protein
VKLRVTDAHQAEVTVEAGAVVVNLGGAVARVPFRRTAGGEVLLEVEGRWTPAWSDGEWAVVAGRSRRIHVEAGRATGPGGSAVSPMPGTLVRLLVAVGDAVEAGAALAVVSAMKTEITLRAEAAGVVSAVRAVPGDRVGAGQRIVEVG